MPAVELLSRPTVSLPKCLLSSHQFAVRMPMTKSPAPPMPSPRAAPPRMPPAPETPSSSICVTWLERAPMRMSISNMKPAWTSGLILALPVNRKREVLRALSTEYRSDVSPSSQYMSDRVTWPLKVSETRRLPLRTVVASSSATRSSRSAQQLPPTRPSLQAGAAPPTAAMARASARRRPPRTVLCRDPLDMEGLSVGVRCESAPRKVSFNRRPLAGRQNPRP